MDVQDVLEATGCGETVPPRAPCQRHQLDRTVRARGIAEVWSGQSHRGPVPAWTADGGRRADSQADRLHEQLPGDIAYVTPSVHRAKGSLLTTSGR